MKINKELIEKVAYLAKLNLSESEKEKFLKDFTDIINSFNVLDTADVKNVKSSFRPIEQKNFVREDVPSRSLDHISVFKFTKNKKNNLFVGPSTIE